MITGSTGSVVSRHDYMPFGEETGSGIGGRTTGMGFSVADGARQKFTSKERDNETGLDYFLARYYSSSQGRFTSPDEFLGGPDELYSFAADASVNPTFYSDLTNPQSLNKYQYVFGNPLSYVDLDGHDGTIAQAVRPFVPLLPALPLAPEIIAGGAAVIVIGEIIGSIPGDATAGDGSCKTCETWNKANQQRMERQEAAGRAEAKRQNSSTNMQQAQGGASGEAQGKPKVNKVTPDPDAKGPHSVAKRDPHTGKVTGYTEYDAKGNPTKRFRPAGKPHGGVKPPLVVEPKKPGGRPNRARPAKQEEIP